MGTFLFIVLIVVIGFQLLGYLAKHFLPQLLMWLVKRRVRNQFGFDPFANPDQQGAKNQRQRARRGQRPADPYAPKRGKIITKDVGEYVEWEDVQVYNNPDDTTTAEVDHAEVKYKTEEQISDAEWEEIK